MKKVYSLLITLALIYFLDHSWVLNQPLPALGKFLDPFHGFWQNGESATQLSGPLHLDGLKEPVTVYYDSAGIPHIFAKNDNDLYFAQGYVTAKDRLWQMDFQVRAGMGRISEVIGKKALDFDRGQRRVGMVYAAQNSLKGMEADPIAKPQMESYTAGVNAFIQSLTPNSLPFEFKLLDYQPEPWTNLHVAMLQINMAKTLNTGEKDLEMTNALKLFGQETLDLLYPEDEKVGDPIVDNPGGWKFKPVSPDTSSVITKTASVDLPPLPNKPDGDVGSNNWAVSGSRTATGSPLLCNDPHLNLTLPSIWYIIHLNAPGVNVMGASLPGGPTVISGFNDSIAWGITNAQRDLVDWYQITFKDSTQKEYLSDGKWLPTRKVVEQFNVKGGEALTDTVTYTHLGPIVYDKHFHGEHEKKQFAYRWIAHDPSLEMVAMHKINRAKNHTEFSEALNYHSSPAQNFVFASVQGDIAMRVQGKYPVRRKDEGKFILDGTRTANEWKAFIPNEHNVAIKNPKRGFVSSANQFPVDATYPYYVHGSSFEAYRNRRINQVLSEDKRFEVKDMMDLQFDVFSLKASETLPDWLKVLEFDSLTYEEKKAVELLTSWDFRNTPDSEAAVYYEAWWNALFPMIWDEIKDSKFTLAYPTRYNTTRLIREQPELSFFDIVSTPKKERAEDVLRLSFSAAVKAVEEWKVSKETEKVRWGDFKDTYIGHLLRIEGLSYHVQHGGNSDNVNASSRTHGPSWRMVVSLEKTGVRAWGIYPGGQSGNPGSSYYNNLLDDWTKGKYTSFHFTHDEAYLKKISHEVVQLTQMKTP